MFTRIQLKKVPQKPKQKKPIQTYTPEPEELPPTLPNVPGFPDWSQDFAFKHIYEDIVKISIPDRPGTLPSLYQYQGPGVHPVRHLYDATDDAPTYIYVFDSRPEGVEHAQQASRIHKIPQGPLKRMEELGKLLIACVVTF